jgi:hypothetical protein
MVDRGDIINVMERSSTFSPSPGFFFSWVLLQHPRSIDFLS